MTDQRRRPFPIDGIDTDDFVAFLLDALGLMRHRRDMADLCALLTTKVRDFLPVAGVAVVFADGGYGPAVSLAAGSSDSERRAIEELLDDDMVRACLETGTPGSRGNNAGDGATATHVLPVGAPGTVFGALVLVSAAPLTDHHLDVAAIVADTAAVAYLQTNHHFLSASLRARFTDLVRSLDVIEQAKGMLSQRHGTGVDAAFDALWKVGLDHGMGLSALAGQVVTRSLDDELSAALGRELTHPASAPAE